MKLKSSENGQFWPKSKGIGFGFWWNLALKQLPLILVWSEKVLKMGIFSQKVRL